MTEVHPLYPNPEEPIQVEVIREAHTTQTDERRSDRLFVHARRRDWGVGLLVVEGPTKRRLRFQDGTLRVFKRGFYHLLHPYETSPAAEKALLAELEEQHGALDQEEQRIRTRDPAAQVSFSQQLRVFEHQWPGGFRDPGWLDRVRRPAEGPARKRHVEGAIGAARAALTQPELDDRLARGQASEIVRRVAEILDTTALASPSRIVRPVRATSPEHHEPIARALRDLLHGAGKHRDRMRRWILALEQAGLTPSWPMVTLLPALSRPTEHVCVKRSVFREQALSVLPNVTVQRRPTPRGYERARKLARTLDELLRDAGHQPADHFDVRAFVWETLRPRGKKVLDRWATDQEGA